LKEREDRRQACFFTVAAVSTLAKAVTSKVLPREPVQETLGEEAFREAAIFQPGLYFPRWESVLEDAAQPPTILIVDDIDLNRRLLKAVLKTASYRILEAKRPAEALSLLGTERIDLVVVDLVMPELSGPDFCRILKSDRKTQFIPILMTTSVQGAQNEVEGIQSGADEFLIKPLQPAVVRTRIHAMLRNKALVDSLEEAETILFALAQSVEHRDKYTGLHCERLACHSLALGQALGLSRRDQLALYRGGYLHDIGKISIPDAILYKHGLLTEEEWRTMRLHTVRGEEMCRPMKTLAPVLPIIRSHHERWDGSGYPDGLCGEEIPLLARILQVADIYDALTTARPYKPAFSHQHAVEIMIEEARRGWRDPELVPLFAEVSQRETGKNAENRKMTVVPMRESLENMRRQLSK
jgi:putative two-component system response regulator